MNNKISLDAFKKLSIYNEFMDKNKGIGRLMLRAYSANEAIPIEGVKVVVSLDLDNYGIIFFEGVTDESGMIPKIELPAPVYSEDNLVAPLYTTYDVKAIYNNKEYVYKVNLYDDVCVVQIINVIPSILERGFYYGG